VVIVPAFAVGEQGRPPEVGRAVVGCAAAVAPLVAGRVGEPGAMEDDDQTHKDAPDDEGPAANQEEQQAERDLEWDHIAVEKAVDRIAGQVFGEARIMVKIHALFGHVEHPAHVTPPEAAVGVVGVGLGVRVSVVHAVMGNPQDWTTLHAEGT